MKNFKNKLKRSILFYTIIYIIIFVITHFILKIFNFQFREWVYYASVIVSSIGILLGIIQILRKKSKKTKIIASILIIILLILSSPFILVFYLTYMPEHVVTKENKKYVAYVNAFLDVRVEYYDYINLFLSGNILKIREYYGDGGFDPLNSSDEYNNYGKEPLTYYYYDDNGNIISTNDMYDVKYKNSIVYDNDGNIIADLSIEDNQSTNNNQNEEKINNDYIEILYEKKIDDMVSIRIINKGYILAQRIVIGIEKTTDGGNTWINQCEDGDGFIEVNNGTEYVFLNENIGFIKDPGLIGTNGENKKMLVTTDGGRSFTTSKILENNNISGNLFFEDLPYLENDNLKVKCYTIKDSQKVYYDLYSLDDGLTWKY